MENIKRKTLVVTIMTLLSMVTVAQSAEKPRISREQLAEKQANYIAHEIALDDATTKKFVSTYCAYQKEVWALGPKVKENKMTEISEDESKQLIEARFERSQKILTIREKYYKEYSKFLTAKQIERVYELEKQIMHQLSKKRKGGKR